LILQLLLQTLRLAQLEDLVDFQLQLEYELLLLVAVAH